MSDRIVVHAAVEGFFDVCHGQNVDSLVSLTDRFDGILERHARGWLKPSADEAILVAEPPWEPGGRALDWAERLQEEVGRKLGLDLSIGIAATRVAARICARMARPRGILLWMKGHEQQLVGGLPLEELDELTPDQLARLRRKGVRSLDELAGLGAGEAREILGSQSDKVLGLVKGTDPVVDTTRGSRLQKACALLSRRLARKLGAAGKCARGLELSLVYEDGVSLERYSLLPRPTFHEDDLWRATSRLLEQVPRRACPVVGVASTATGLTSQGGQLQLFDGTHPREVVVRIGRRAPASAVF